MEFALRRGMYHPVLPCIICIVDYLIPDTGNNAFQILHYMDWDPTDPRKPSNFALVREIFIHSLLGDLKRPTFIQ